MAKKTEAAKGLIRLRAPEGIRSIGLNPTGEEGGSIAIEVGEDGFIEVAPDLVDVLMTNCGCKAE